VCDKPRLYLRKQFFQELERVARKKIAALLKRKSIARVKNTIVIARATAAGAIARHAKNTRVNMIIMGSRGRTGLKNLLMRSAAEKTVG
jgi:nucleotide-binding universal stress UspA family protein